MSDVDEVLERLVTDQAFRTRLQDDPVAALGGYVLEEDDLAVLAATLDEGQGSDHGVEQRSSKSALFQALALLSGTGVGAGEQPDLVAPDDEGPTSVATGLSSKGDAADASRIGAPPDVEDAFAQQEAAHPGYVESGALLLDISDPANPAAASGETARGPAGLRSDGELVQASDTRALPEVDATAEGLEGEANGDRLVAPQEPEPDFDAYLELEGVEGESDPPPSQPEMVASEAGLSEGQAEEDEASPPRDQDPAGPADGPRTEPPDLVAEQQTEEAETVHLFLKANGSDMQGESSSAPPDPDDALDDAAGRQDTDR